MLKNYLIQIRNSDSEIYVHGINKIVSDILLKIKTKKTFNNLAKELNIHESLIYKWREDTPISIKRFCYICNQVNDLSFLDKICEKNIMFSSRSSKPIILPKKLTPSLSYLLGLILGDGCITSRKGSLLISSSHLEVKKAELILKNIFGINCSIKQTDNYYLLRTTSAPLKEFLHNIFDIPLGKKKDKIRVPKFVLESGKENKVAFIFGFFNSDGSLSIRKDGRMTFAIKQSTKEILEDILLMLNSINIKAKIYKDRTMNSWSINIFRKEEISKLIMLFDICADSLVVGPQMTSRTEAMGMPSKLAEAS